MRVRDLALMEVETFCGYKDTGVGLLLMAGCNNLVPGNLVMVAGCTLYSSAAPTLQAMALGGRVELMMAHKSRIAILRVAALLADVGMVVRSIQSMSHAARTVRSALEIIGIMQWPGHKCHVSAVQHHWVIGMKNCRHR
jgi:hypothetical protein